MRKTTAWLFTAILLLSGTAGCGSSSKPSAGQPQKLTEFVADFIGMANIVEGKVMRGKRIRQL